MTNRTASKARRAPAPATQARRGPILAVALVALAVVVAIGVAIALEGGDETTGSDDSTLDFGAVEVDGAPLDEFTDGATDSAVGQQAPVLLGQAADGNPVTVGGAGEPTIVAFLAHWCPHCQVELPVLVDVAEAGGFDGVRTVAVLTGTNPDAPNFPPVEWLDGEDWTGDVLIDDEAFSAAAAYGLAGYPFLVALDAEGNVVARTSGELPADQVAALAAAARGDGQG